MRIREKAPIYAAICLMVFTIASGLIHPSVAEAKNDKNRISNADVKIVDAATIRINSITFTQSDYDKGMTDQAKQQIRSLAELNQLMKDNIFGRYDSPDISHALDYNYLHGSDQLGVIDQAKYNKDTGNGCTATIKDQDNEIELINVSLKVGGFDGCKNIFNEGADWKLTDKVSDKSNIFMLFNWKAPNVMVRVDGKDGNYNEDSVKTNPGIFYSNTSNKVSHADENYARKSTDNRDANLTSCRNSVNTNDKRGTLPSSSKFYNLPGESSQYTRANYLEGCDTAYRVPVLVGNVDAKNGSPAALSDGSKGDVTHQVTCESVGTSLSFIICPVIEWLGRAVQGMYTNILAPWLKTDPLTTSNDSTGQSSPVYMAWSALRVYGNIFLVIAILVIVFGQSIGGGLVDAYTAKKVLPRILIAAILINLSFYIVMALVDVTNVLGSGINQLLISFTNGTSLTLGGGVSGTLTLAIFGTIPALIFAAAATGGTIIAALGQAFLLFVFIPAFFAVMGVFITLVLRSGIILGLIILSPVAFAMYCLPNTEQYFKKWWDLLIKALLVYPIVGLVFGVASVLAVTVNHSNDGWIGQAISVVILVIPLFLVPFAFKMAGGLAGSIYGTLAGMNKRGTEAIKGNANDPRSARNRARYGMRSSMNVGRANSYARLAGASKKGGLRGGLAGVAARGINYGNLQAERASMNEEQEKLIAYQYSQGDDSNVRAIWAKKFSGEDDGSGRQAGHWYSPYKEQDGTYKEWSAPDVAKARAIVNKDPSRLQSYAKYEYSKAADDGQLDAFKERLLEIGDESHYSETAMQGLWGGVKFAHQNVRKEQKYINPVKNKETGKFEWGETDHAGLSRELADAVTKGQFSGYRSSTAIASKEGFEQATGRIDGGFDYDNPDVNTKKFSRSADEAAINNYTELAQHLETSYLAPGMSGDQRAALEAQAAAQGGDAAGPGTVGGGGLYGSAHAETAWKDFISTVRSRGAPPPPPGP